MLVRKGLLTDLEVLEEIKLVRREIEAGGGKAGVVGEIDMGRTKRGKS